MRQQSLSTKAITFMLALAACAPQDLQEEAPRLATDTQALVTNRVLILSTSVTSGATSQEALAATQLGFTVEVATPAQWAAKTASDFTTYRAIILGDPMCGSLSAVGVAANNRALWGRAVNGNVIIVGTSPVFHSQGPGALTLDSIAFAAARPDRTGAYISLSCYYASATAGTPVPVLEPFGSFTVSRTSSCYNDVHIVSRHPAMTRITDANLSNWGCSVKEVFDSFPAAHFTPVVIARDGSETSRLPGSVDTADGTHGPAYVLASGLSPLGCGDGEVGATEQCDLGA